jgi:hypothetical protein
MRCRVMWVCPQLHTWCEVLASNPNSHIRPAMGRTQPTYAQLAGGSHHTTLCGWGMPGQGLIRHPWIIEASPLIAWLQLSLLVSR